MHVDHFKYILIIKPHSGTNVQSFGKNLDGSKFHTFLRGKYEMSEWSGLAWLSANLVD